MKTVDRMFWGGLVAIMLIVTAVFVRDQIKPAVTLPVIGAVGSFALTNQFGVRTEASHLDNYVWVADVVFTTCPGQCHQLSQMMRRIQRRLPLGAPVRLVSLTADPERDQPPVMMRYGARYGFDAATWIFLTGEKADVYALAKGGLLFSVVENENAKDVKIQDQFIHSASFAVVDRRGRLRAMVQAEDADAEDRILAYVKSLLKER